MINIVCFGSSLRADDSVGLLVFELLQYELDAKPFWADQVQLNYAGNAGARALPYFLDCEYLVVVDAIMPDTPTNPGAIHKLSAHDVSHLDDGSLNHAYSSHLLAFPQCWQLLRSLGKPLPKLTIMAIEISNVKLCQQLVTPDVEKAAKTITKNIMRYCRSLITKRALL